MDTTILLAKVKDPAALDALAGLTLDVLLERPLGALVPAELAVSVTRRAVEGWVSSDLAVPALERLVEALANRMTTERRTLKELTARDLRGAVRDIVGRPFSPDKKLVLTIIDREPVRELVRELLLDTILDFGRKVSAPMAGVAKGLGSLARLATETVKARGGAFGSVVGAVSGEVERQLEKRAVEFVDAALAGVFGQLADSVSDPRRASEAAELRVAVFDGVMELSVHQLARELVNADVPGGAEVLRGGLRRWLASADSDLHLKAIADWALERDGGRPLREVLAEAGQLDLVRTVGREQLRARMEEVVASPAFAAWLTGLGQP